MGNTTTRLNRRRLGNYEAISAGRELPQVHQMPVLRVPVDCTVFAHRRDDNAIVQRDTPHLEGREQLTAHKAIPSVVS